MDEQVPFKEVMKYINLGLKILGLRKYILLIFRRRLGR
jgi:hypothetical protein